MVNILSFPKEAKEEINLSFEKLCKAGQKDNLLLAYKEMCNETDGGNFIQQLDNIAQKSGIHKYTVYLIFVLKFTDELKRIFKEKNISDNVFYETCSDIKYKLFECHNVYGVWGVFPIRWFRKLLLGNIFKLGRLEYETVKYKFECGYKDVLKKGDNCIALHIPSSGPLLIPDVIDSLKMAYKFFNASGDMVIYTHSWLVYPPFYPLFKDGSNMQKFYNLFDIYYAEAVKGKSVIWRIFNVPPETELDLLPRDNSLRQNFYNYLKSGNDLGEGLGAIVFDGEKIKTGKLI